MRTIIMVLVGCLSTSLVALSTPAVAFDHFDQFQRQLELDILRSEMEQHRQEQRRQLDNLRLELQEREYEARQRERNAGRRPYSPLQQPDPWQ